MTQLCVCVCLSEDSRMKFLSADVTSQLLSLFRSCLVLVLLLVTHIQVPGSGTTTDRISFSEPPEEARCWPHLSAEGA